MSEEKTKVRFYIICSDHLGRRAVLHGESYWNALCMEDVDHMDGFLIENLHEIETASEFVNQRLVITDEEFTKLAKNSHQFISVIKTKKP